MEATFNKSIAQLVHENYRTAAVFERHQLDFCCGGKQTLAEACQRKNLDTLAVLEDLEEVQEGENFIQPRVGQWTTSFLIEYIINNHHEYIRDNGTRIEAYIKRVADSHKDDQPESTQIFQLFNELLIELDSHLDKEENDFFPVLIALSKGEETVETLSPYMLSKIKNELVIEHKNVGGIMHKIRKLCQDYIPPMGACASMKLAYSELLAFERDLHRHIHLENNVLLQRFSLG